MFPYDYAKFLRTAVLENLESPSIYEIHKQKASFKETLILIKLKKIFPANPKWRFS